MQQLSKLPALSTTYPLFDWTTSNGDATAEQTHKAYTAITTKGLCSDFSRLVWNDLVNLLSVALSEAGLPWITTYGTAASTLIPEYLGQLTANRFNAMVCNIGQLYYPNWYWVTSGPGKIGRTYVRGKVQTGNFRTADGVYGKYIVELAEQLNLFLRVLQDDSGVVGHVTFAENIESRSSAPLLDARAGILAHQSRIQTNINAPLFPGVAGFLEHQSISASNLDALLFPGSAGFLAAGTRALTVHHAAAERKRASFVLVKSIAESNVGGDLRPIQSDPIHVAETAKASVGAVVDVQEPSLLKVRGASRSRVKAKLAAARWFRISSAVKSLASTAARAARYVAQRLGISLHSATSTGAELHKAPPGVLIANGAAASNEAADLIKYGISAHKSTEKSRTSTGASLQGKTPQKATSEAHAATGTDAVTEKYRPSRASADTNTETSTSAVAKKKPPSLIGAAVKSVSRSAAKVMRWHPTVQESSVRSESQLSANAAIWPPKLLTVLHRSVSSAGATATKWLAEHLRVAEQTRSAADADLSKWLPERLTVTEKAQSIVSADAIPCKPEFATADGYANSRSDALIETKKPQLILSGEMAESRSVANMERKPPMGMDAADTIRSSAAANALKPSPKVLKFSEIVNTRTAANLWVAAPMYSNEVSKTRTSAKISFAAWIYGEDRSKSQTQALLRVAAPLATQSQSQTVANPELRDPAAGILKVLGAAGTKIAAQLRVAAPMQAKEHAKSIVYAMLTLTRAETQDWYDPVQDGNDLYIRSAFVFWREGENGSFIPVFFEPVQDGSDLYITSAYPFWQEEENGNFVDNVNEPVQTDGDLYIQSANSLWVEKAIDDEQNILGGE